VERNARLILVSSFVLLTLVALFLFYRWAQAPDAQHMGEARRIQFKGSVSGLSIGSEVRYLGVSVGRVVSIRLSPDYHGRVDVSMASEQALPDSNQLLARLEAQGITGLSIIELEDRLPATDIFEHDAATIPGYPSILSQLSGSAGRITQGIEQTLLRLNTLLDEDSVADFDATLRHTRQLAENLAAASEKFDDMLDNTSAMGDELSQALPEFRDAVRQLDRQVLPAITRAGESLQSLSITANGVIEENRTELNQLMGEELPSLVGVTDELAETLQEINRLIGNINGQPGALLYGEQVKEVEITRE
jgi:phospholipid/cholesterol/gamma-HCH transport system substrate-binding protein